MRVPAALPQRVAKLSLFTLLIACLLSAAPEGLNLGVRLELRDKNGDRFERLEASGIAYYRKRLVIVDDIVSTLFVFDREGRLTETVELNGFPPQGAKFEDLVFDAATGDFFAVGSHSGTNREIFESTSVLARFRLQEGDQGLEVGDAGVDTLPLYRSFEKLGLWRPGGMKIEGLALDSAAGDLYVGLREPSDLARVYRVDLEAIEEATRTGVAPVPELEVSFDAGSVEGTPFCVSALLWIPERRGLLIATSTEEEATHRFAGNRLWFYSRSNGVQLVQDTFDEGLKAEGLTMGDGDVYISYDNDQDDTDIPSQMRVMPAINLLGAHGQPARLSGTMPN